VITFSIWNGWKRLLFFKTNLSINKKAFGNLENCRESILFSLRMILDFLKHSHQFKEIVLRKSLLGTSSNPILFSWKSVATIPVINGTVRKCIFQMNNDFELRRKHSTTARNRTQCVAFFIEKAMHVLINAFTFILFREHFS
jgi:hypothetical protein